MEDFDPLTVSPEISLREAVAVIDRCAVGIALVTDSSNRLLGTVTDGDIRRAILRGLPLETQISEVMNQRFTAVGPETSEYEGLNLMQARGIKHLPVLDSAGRLIGIYLLQELIGEREQPNWVVIMAGGRGRRLWPLTEGVPKPMLMVGGRPLLERTITQLVAYGFRRIFLSIWYLGHQIEDFLGDGKEFGCKIEYLKEESPLGTGGALSLLPGKPEQALLVINGDLFTEMNFTALLAYHAHNQHTATLCVREFEYQIPYGVVEIEEHKVLEIREKPMQRCLINAGIYVLEPDALTCIPVGVEYDLPKLFERLRQEGRSVGAFPIRERWIDIGRLEDYQQAQRYFNVGGEKP